MLDFLKRIITFAVIATALTFNLSAQETAPQVSLLTISPGKEVYELDGHTAMRFYSPGRYDYVVNWGVFDFHAPNFIYRFVKGETDYLAWPLPFEFFIEGYRQERREVTEQIFNLTPEQAIRLETLVDNNLRPENRKYRYNYIYDNCATRPLALVETAIGKPLVINSSNDFIYGETDIKDCFDSHTFRTEMARSHANYPWYQFGIDLALGSGLDKEITPRERTYYPLYLKSALASSYYTNDKGEKLPLIKSTEVILPAQGRVTASSTPFLLTPISVSILILIISLAIALRDTRRHKITQWFDSALYGCFFIVSLLMTFLIFVSVHEATSPNWLYLWLNPLTCIPAIFIWLNSYKRAVYYYQICNFVALFLLLIVGIANLQALNMAFYPLILADLALSIRYIYVYRRVDTTINPKTENDKR